MISCRVSNGSEGKVDLNLSWVKEAWDITELEKQWWFHQIWLTLETVTVRHKRLIAINMNLFYDSLLPLCPSYSTATEFEDKKLTVTISPFSFTC